MANTPPSSSKIPRWVKAIHITGDKYTKILTKERFKPAGSEEVITEELPKKSDQPRHGDFDRALQMLKVHAILRPGFAEPLDKFGKPITQEWFADHLYEDDARFMDVTVTGIIITTKETSDNFQIKVECKAVDGAITKFTCPPISTLTVEGWNYPLRDFAKLQLETLLIEADEYRKGKSSLGQLKMALVA